jgi:hypothetical protein
MPGSRTLANPVGKNIWYWANAPSKAVPASFGQEETIKAIWAEDKYCPGEALELLEY